MVSPLTKTPYPWVPSLEIPYSYSLRQSGSQGLRGQSNILLQIWFQKTSSPEFSKLWYKLFMQPISSASSCPCFFDTSLMIVPSGRVRKLNNMSIKSPLASATTTQFLSLSTRRVKESFGSCLEAMQNNTKTRLVKKLISRFSTKCGDFSLALLFWKYHMIPSELYIWNCNGGKKETSEKFPLLASIISTLSPCLVFSEKTKEKELFFLHKNWNGELHITFWFVCFHEQESWKWPSLWNCIWFALARLIKLYGIK